mgnify:CR=1 FL=1
MQAVSRNSAGGFAQHGIGPGRAVGTNDFKCSVGVTKAFIDVMEQIEKFGIDHCDVTGTEVAQEVIELAECVALIAVANTISDSYLFVCMQVVKR